jgi:hypothetical protein
MDAAGFVRTVAADLPDHQHAGREHLAFAVAAKRPKDGLSGK